MIITNKFDDETLLTHLFNNTIPTTGADKSPLFIALWKGLSNTYEQKATRNAEKYNRWLVIRATTKQLLFDWCLRIRQIHIKTVAIMRFSMNLLFSHCPQAIWNILSHLRLAFCYNKTLQFYEKANQIPLYIRVATPQHNTIVVIGADNMSYSTHTDQPRVMRNGSITHTIFIDTINWWQRFYPPNAFPNFGRYDHMVPFIREVDMPHILADIVVDNDLLNTRLDASFDHSLFVINSDNTHLAYPPLNVCLSNDPTNSLPRFHFHIPFHDLVTSKYTDMFMFLEHIHHKFLCMWI